MEGVNVLLTRRLVRLAIDTVVPIPDEGEIRREDVQGRCKLRENQHLHSTGSSGLVSGLVKPLDRRMSWGGRQRCCVSYLGPLGQQMTQEVMQYQQFATGGDQMLEIELIGQGRRGSRGRAHGRWQSRGGIVPHEKRMIAQLPSRHKGFAQCKRGRCTRLLGGVMDTVLKQS